MSDIIQIFKCEQNSITPFQRELHFLSNNPDDEDTISSPYTDAFPTKVAFRSEIDRMLESSSTDDIVKYKVANKEPLDVLEKIVMIVDLPEIELRDEYKEEYRIAWRPNIAHEMITDAKMLTDKDVKQTFTSLSLVAHRNYLLDTGLDRDVYLKSIGNVKHLTDWNTYLPPDDLNWIQSWMFCEEGKTLPLYMCRQTEIHFEYTFNLNISNLLLMQKLVSGKWVNITFNKKFIKKVPNEYKVSNPKIKATYLKITDEEKDRRSRETGGDCIRYHDYISIGGNDKNEIIPKYIDKLQMKSILPLKSLFIIPVNRNVNVRTFTYKGHSIIESFTMTYQKDKEKIPKCTHNYIRDIYSKYYPRIQYEEGIVGIPFCRLFNSINSDVAIAPNSDMDAEAIIVYDNTDPYMKRYRRDENANDEDDVNNDEDEGMSIRESQQRISMTTLENRLNKKLIKCDRFIINYLFLVSKQLKFRDGKCLHSE